MVDILVSALRKVHTSESNSVERAGLGGRAAKRGCPVAVIVEADPVGQCARLADARRRRSGRGHGERAKRAHGERRAAGAGDRRRLTDYDGHAHFLVIDGGRAAAIAGRVSRIEGGSAHSAGESCAGATDGAERGSERHGGAIGDAESGPAARIGIKIGDQTRAAVLIDLRRAGADAQYQPGIGGQEAVVSARFHSRVAAACSRTSVAAPPVVGGSDTRWFCIGRPKPRAVGCTVRISVS